MGRLRRLAGHRARNDLRDTIASRLLRARVQLGYVSVQLGHADVSMTARYYARWIEGEDYRADALRSPVRIARSIRR